MSASKPETFKEQPRGTFAFDLSKFITYRDREVCERVRRIRKQEICNHSNRDFRIRVIEDSKTFYSEFAGDLVHRIRVARDEGRKFVAILPVGPTPQYELAARKINELRLSCHHVHTFNMDEYADENGNTAPTTWPGSFQSAMMENFFSKIDPPLRLTTRSISLTNTTSKAIAE
jgi:glucosamine-6-phosphate deaminase